MIKITLKSKNNILIKMETHSNKLPIPTKKNNLFLLLIEFSPRKKIKSLMENLINLQLKFNNSNRNKKKKISTSWIPFSKTENNLKKIISMTIRLPSVPNVVVVLL